MIHINQTEGHEQECPTFRSTAIALYKNDYVGDFINMFIASFMYAWQYQKDYIKFCRKSFICIETLLIDVQAPIWIYLGTALRFFFKCDAISVQKSPI